MKHSINLLIISSVLTLSSLNFSGVLQANSENITKKLTINDAISNLRKGFTLRGTLSQERVFYTDDNFTDIDSSQTGNLKASSNIELGFTEHGFSRKAEMLDTRTNTYTSEFDDAYFEDDNGYTYSEYLSYDNQVVKNYLTSNSALISFVGTFLDNHFFYIFGSDFTGTSTNEYELDNEKVSQLFSKLCYFMSVGLKGVPSVNTFTMDDDGNFSKFYFEPEDRKVSETDTISQSSLYYIIHQSVTFDFLKICETSIDYLTPVKKEESSANSALKSAFSKFNENNVIITVRDDSTSNSTTTSSTNKFYFDGTNAYVKYFNESKGSESELNSVNDYILRIGEDGKHYEAYGYDADFESWDPSNSTKFGKLNQDTYVYSNLTPVVNSLSSELFIFDKTTNLYKLDKDYLSIVAGYTLTPVFKEVKSNNILNASSLSLKLDNSGNLSSVIIKYSYYNSSYNSYTGTVYVNYSNQGSTVIPFSALDNL